MALRNTKIEHMHGLKHPKAGKRRWLKNQRNRLIRRSTDPLVKYKGWEY